MAAQVRTCSTGASPEPLGYFLQGPTRQGSPSPLNDAKCSRCSTSTDRRRKRTCQAFVVKSAPTNHRSGLAPNRVTRFPPLWERRFAPSMIFFNHQSRGICDAGASKACRYPCSVPFLSAHTKTAQDIRSVHMSRSPIDGNHFVPRVDCV
jgi:hypothetical protein